MTTKLSVNIHEANAEMLLAYVKEGVSITRITNDALALYRVFAEDQQKYGTGTSYGIFAMGEVPKTGASFPVMVPSIVPLNKRLSKS